MTSINTNNGAMVALKTLKSINSNLGATQSEIATGKKVSSSKDNAAVWAISKVMESDASSFQGISDSLSLGESTVAVARQASETVTDLLTKMKDKIVSAQGENVDKAKIQTDIDALTSQISSVVGAAQFNGLNLLDGSTATTSVLSSLNRDSSGTVSTATISISGVDFSQGSYTAVDVFSGSTAGSSTDGDSLAITLDKSTGTGDMIIDASSMALGDKISVSVGGKTASYTMTQDDLDSADPNNNVAFGLKNAIDKLGVSDLTVDFDGATSGTLNFTNGGTSDLSVTAQYKNADAGDLALLSTIDVTSDAATALDNISTLIATAVDATAAFGSMESRIQSQSSFISDLSSTMKSGIGTLTDANMEEASARLQALQTQQQLGIQALSIANQAPSSIMSLFR
ncbi:flagellin N-terminal helical domain-containing protein [Phaeovulum sp. W22_SRMD_FR3]|jgi:flagellin|uniref:flagellin N-terminal helical domain-containing protein n=1 Tax=Phaeovulum sp. W22_SRMD_FR3 TaxID=3240274 RepID=UPI003F94ECE8